MGNGITDNLGLPAPPLCAKRSP